MSEERACAAAVMTMILLAPAPLPVCCDQGLDSAISSPCKGRRRPDAGRMPAGSFYPIPAAATGAIDWVLQWDSEL